MTNRDEGISEQAEAAANDLRRLLPEKVDYVEFYFKPQPAFSIFPIVAPGYWMVGSKSRASNRELPEFFWWRCCLAILRT